MFYVSLLEQNTIRKGWVDENVTEFEVGSADEEYKVERIWNSTVYAKESATDYLPGLYYLVSWKSYPKEKNIWESALTVQHLRKLIGTFHKDNPNKPTATSPPVDTATPMAQPTMLWSSSKPTKATKQKRGWPATNTLNKKAKIQYPALPADRFSSLVPTGSGSFSLISIYRFFLLFIIIYFKGFFID